MYAEARKFVFDSLALMSQLENALKSAPSTVAEVEAILKNEAMMKELLAEDWIKTAKNALQSSIFKIHSVPQKTYSVIQRLLVVFGMKIYCTGTAKVFRTCADIMIAIDKTKLVLCE